jgi:valyl-tRNA synthetase
LNISPAARVIVHVKGSDDIRVKIEKMQQLIQQLARVENAVPGENRPRGPVAFSPIRGGEIYILLEGLVDLKAEEAKLKKEREKLEKYVLSIQGKLSNEQFVKNAPPELVDGEKAKLRETQDKVSKITNSLKFLEG